MNQSILPICAGIGIGLGIAVIYSNLTKSKTFQARFGSLVTLKVYGYSTVTIDNQTFSGYNIIVENGQVIINGKQKVVYCKCTNNRNHIHLFTSTISGNPTKIEMLTIYPTEMIKDENEILMLNPSKTKLRHDVYDIVDGNIVRENSYHYMNYYNGSCV